MYTFEKVISELLKHDDEAVQSYFSCYQEHIDKSIKIIKARVEIEKIQDFAKKFWWALEKQPYTRSDDIYFIKRSDESYGLWKHRLHTGGFFYMQEVAASLPVQMIDIRPGDIVLDMCAAPWGKSVQLHDKGAFVVSNEVSGSRIVSLQHNLNRTWCIASCVSSLQGGNRGNISHELFNHVLVDTPCSWEGTGFKSDDGLKRWREDNIHKIARLQKELLLSAIKACKVWWTVIYSTCTINPRENELVVADALEKYWEYVSLENVEIENKSPWIISREEKEIVSLDNANKLARFRPHIQKTWWFFIAKFIKTQSFPQHPLKKLNNWATTSQLDISDKLQEKIREQLLHDYGIIIDTDKYLFVSSPKQIYLTDRRYMNIHEAFPMEKAGVPVFKWDNNNNLRPLHWLWNCLWRLATKNKIEILEKDLQRYSDWFDLTFSDYADTYKAYTGYVILTYQDMWFSVGKIVNDTIKNKYSKS
jgi:16S rRNA C967 or C1407 C5-methylase (RsmB/RsmF family)